MTVLYIYLLQQVLLLSVLTTQTFYDVILNHQNCCWIQESDSNGQTLTALMLYNSFHLCKVDSDEKNA